MRYNNKIATAVFPIWRGSRRVRFEGYMICLERKTAVFFIQIQIRSKRAVRRRVFWQNLWQERQPQGDQCIENDTG